MKEQYKKEVNTNKNTKGQIPFAVFISQKSNMQELGDFKHVFTDIISDRIKEKYE